MNRFGLLLCLLCSCGQEEPRHTQPDVAPATNSAAWPLISDSVWPAVPSGTAPGNATWQTIRHETIHVHIAMPAGFRVERGRLEFGHPVVNLIGPEFTAAITFSSGPAHVALSALGPNARRVNTEENTTDVFTRDGLRVVLGAVRGARCEIAFRRGDEDTAVRICASMRVPRPGRIGQATVAVPGPFPPIPEYATVNNESGVAQMHAGHFAIRVLPRACRSVAEIRAASSPTLELSERSMPHGLVLVGRDHLSNADEQWIGDVAIWATRQNACCIATIPDFREPSAQQVNYVAQLCDTMAVRADPAAGS